MGVTVFIIAPGVLIATLASLRGVDPTQFSASARYLVVAAIIHLVGAFAGGFTTSRITAGRSLYAVFLLLSVLVTALVAQAVKSPPKPGEPTWYSFALAAIVGAGVLLGAFMGRRGLSAGQQADAPA